MAAPSFIDSGYELFSFSGLLKIVSKYDQGIPQSQTADNPLAPRGRAAIFEMLSTTLYKCPVLFQSWNYKE